MDILKEGARGPDVDLAQAALARAGFYNGEIDGIFGPRTRAAVMQYQRAYGLKPDGIVGPETWNALMPWIKGYVTQRLVPGDTMYRLALVYGTNIQAIKTANPGINPQQLTPGQELIIPLGFPVVFTNIRFTYEALSLAIDGLTARYPFLQNSTIGRSVAGNDLYAIAIGTGEKQVFYNASHHANEWITTPILMKFLEEYAAAYVKGRSIAGIPAAQIYESTTIYLVPMVNPDGVDLVTGAIPEYSEYYRQALAMNNPPVDFPSGWKANIRGVDLNLNYPAGWDNAKEIKYAQGYTTPGPRDYVGPYPLSEPESAAVASFTKDNNFMLTLSYHTQGETIYWKYLDYNPEGSYEIARRFAEVSGYTVEETPYTSGFAGYKDWFIQEYNRPGYTIEAGLGVNPLPISQFDQIYRDNIGILTLGAILTG